MGTVTGTLTIEETWNRKKNQEFHACTKNIRTINKGFGSKDTLLGIGTKIGT